MRKLGKKSNQEIKPLTNSNRLDRLGQLAKFLVIIGHYSKQNMRKKRKMGQFKVHLKDQSLKLSYYDYQVQEIELDLD